jgi:hypothetical protein
VNVSEAVAAAPAAVAREARGAHGVLQTASPATPGGASSAPVARATGGSVKAGEWATVTSVAQALEIN